MYRFIFRLQNGRKVIMEDVSERTATAIWNKPDRFCSGFETPTNKVVTIRQELMK